MLFNLLTNLQFTQPTELGGTVESLYTGRKVLADFANRGGSYLKFSHIASSDKCSNSVVYPGKNILNGPCLQRNTPINSEIM